MNKAQISKEVDMKRTFNKTKIFIFLVLIASVCGLIFNCALPSGKKQAAVHDLGPLDVDEPLKAIEIGPFTTFSIDNVTHKWIDISAVRNNPDRIVIADIQTFNGDDPCNVRFDYDEDNGNRRQYLACAVQEELSYNTEMTHIYGETVAGLFVNAEEGNELGDAGEGYFSVGNDHAIYDVDGEVIGYAAYTYVAQDNRDQTHRIDIPFNEIGGGHAPVIFANVRTFNGNESVHVRIMNVEWKSFTHNAIWQVTYKLEEWRGFDGRHNEERVDFLILKQGIHVLGSAGSYQGRSYYYLLEVGNHKMKNGNIDYNKENHWETIHLIHYLGTSPVVITQTQSFNGSHECVTRNKNIGGLDFEVIVQEDEARYKGDGDTGHNKEDIGYLAMSRVTFNWRYSDVVEKNGNLDADNKNNLENENGQEVQLKGVSSFWTNWSDGYRYVNHDVISHLISRWEITVYRVAMGVRPTNPAGLDVDNDGLGDLETPLTGYVDAKARNLENVEEAIRVCIRYGIYVIVDWHVHDALRPGNKEAAIEFFDYISKKYGMYDNIIYEIWNEPGWPGHVRFPEGVTNPDSAKQENPPLSWSTIKSYCKDIIEVIRKNDDDNVIICPSPCWDQWIDEVASSPITGCPGCWDIMYSFHFYAGSHMIEKNKNNSVNPTPANLIYYANPPATSWPAAESEAYSHLSYKRGDKTPAPCTLGMDVNWPKLYRLLWQWNFDPWSRLDKNINKIPIFVTEWGTSLYDGGQENTSTEAYTDAAEDWIEYMDEHNLSWCNWSISDKNEGASALKPGASTCAYWSDDDLTDSGKFIKRKLTK
jgi:hypothetical protein